MNYVEVKKSFEESIKGHKMEVLHDSGVYRHLKFTNNGSNIYRFDIVTYPGHLAISGDCGAYLFRRLDDMFMFDNWLSFGYVAEKCIAEDWSSKCKEFSADALKSSVMAWFDEWHNSCFDEISQPNALKMRDETLDIIAGVSNAYEAYECLMNLSIDGYMNNGEEVVFTIDDVSEVIVEDYSWRFIWCCYAINYAVEKYKTKGV